MRANRRLYLRRFALLAIAIVISSLVAASHIRTVRSGNVVSAAGPQRLERLLDRLTRDADLAPRHVRTGGRVRVLTEIVAGKPWRLAYGETRNEICWLLVVPQTVRDVTCGRAAEVQRRQLLIYAGARLDDEDPARVDGYVVYGWVAPTVQSLRLTLSDCSTLPVSLATRPLFWAFVSSRKLTEQALPIRFLLTVRGHSRRGSLQPLAPTRVQALSRCQTPALGRAFLTPLRPPQARLR
jgi:hypothetical protein